MINYFFFFFAVFFIPFPVIAAPSDKNFSEDRTSLATETVNQSQGALNWRIVADDIKLATIRIPSTFLLGSELLFVKSSLTRYKLGVINQYQSDKPRSNIRQMATRSGAVMAINANFFDESGKPLGLVVSGGHTHQAIHRGGQTMTGILKVEREKLSIVSRDSFDSRNVLEAVQAGPRLITKRQRVKGLRERSSSSRRSGICLAEDNSVVFFVLRPGLLGLNLEKLQNILLGLGPDCIDSLNFDGGGSSQFFLSSNLPGAAPGQKDIYLPGRDDIPVAIGLFPRSFSQ